MSLRCDSATTMSTRVNTNASYHAKNQFTNRIHHDTSLLATCWYDGVDIEAPKRDYDVARLYDGPLCDDCCMFAVDTDLNDCDCIIRTVIPADDIEYHVVE